MKRNLIYQLLVLLITLSMASLDAQEGPVAIWKFQNFEKEEKITSQGEQWWQKPVLERRHSIEERISGNKGSLYGNFFKLVPGVSGNAILLDGITSYVECKGNQNLAVSGDFSLGAWIALGAYPINWCPVADFNISSGKGYFLGIDALGHAGFKLYDTDGKLHEIKSEERILLRKWTHIEGVYSSSKGMVLYLDGQAVAHSEVDGEFSPANDANLLIGKHSIKRRPEGTIRPHATEEVYSYFDGLIDELTVYNQSRSPNKISAYVKQTLPSSPPSLLPRSLPSVPAPGEFGAVYTTLKYYEAWDALWRVGNSADVVVRFNDMDGKLIFWRGTGYIPHWVSENGIWNNNEFVETWSETGCHEPMSDKRCQFAKVQIVENTPARVVVHWRYALNDNWYNISRVDSLTGWGEWVDEVYTVYPDGVAVRKVILYSVNPATSFEWQESISVMGPGQKPEDNLQAEALTFSNLKGDICSYSWKEGLPTRFVKEGFILKPETPSIQLINTNAELKPFVILDPTSNPKWRIFSSELHPERSIFPWWNHWPTAQNACDGRFAMDTDQASHSSLSNASWDTYSETDYTVTKIMLHGLTTAPADHLVPLAKSWSNPPELKIKGSDSYKNNGYDKSERIYQLTCLEKGDPEELTIEMNASVNSPVKNFCLLIKNWGRSDPSIELNDIPLPVNKEYYFGHNMSIEGTDLLIWVESESKEPITLTISPK